MPKFSDIPYFIIKDYINQIDPTKALQRSQPVVEKWEGIKFCDYFDDQSYCNEKDYTIPDSNDAQGTLFEIGQGAAYWNNWYETASDKEVNNSPLVDSNKHISYLRRPNDIIVNGGTFMDFYIKDVDYGFRPIRLMPLFNEPEEQIYFDFWDVQKKRTTKGSQIVRTLIGPDWICDDSQANEYNTCPDNGFTHRFQDYNISSEILTNLDELVGSEVYIRKDSPFFFWLKNSAYAYYLNKWEVEFNIRNFINTDKSFIYFGQIYPITHKTLTIGKPTYHIIFDGLKDFVKRAIPEHQRTTNLLKYLEIYFDRVYNEVYSLQKNIFTLKDPLEIDRKYLSLYLKKYSIDYEMYLLDDLNYREFVRDIPYLLKSKSTYASFKIIWRLISGTRNEFNLYERWHDKDLRGKIYEHEYTNINYLDRYLSGTFETDTDGLILSTAYNIDMDLTLEPMSYDEIEPDKITNNLYYLMELFRPVNRVTQYSYSISPIVDFSGDWISLYVNNPDHMMSRFLSKNDFTNFSWIYLQEEESNEWIVNHGLNSVNILTQIIDMDGQEIVPSKVEFTNNDTITIEFDKEEQGVCLLRRADWFIYNDENIDEWVINHPLNSKEVLVQFKTLKGAADIGECIPSEFIEDNLDHFHKKSVVISDWDYDDYYYKNITHNLSRHFLPINVWNINTGELEKSAEIESINSNETKISISDNIEYNINLFKDKNEDNIYNITESNWIYNGDYYYTFVNHNLNHNYPNVYVWNVDTRRVEELAKVNQINKNSILIYSTEPLNLFLNINASLSNSVVSKNSWDRKNNYFSSIINHNQRDLYPFVTAWNLETNEVEHIRDIKVINNNSLEIRSEKEIDLRVNINYTSASQTAEAEEKMYVGDIKLSQNRITIDGVKGTSMVTDPDHIIYIESEAKSIWEINHNLNKRGLMIQCYDLNNISVNPSEYIIKDNNNIEIHFDFDIRGYVVIKDIGHYFFKKILQEKINGSYDLEIKVGTIEDSLLNDGIIYQEVINNIDIRDGIYNIPFTIPRSEEETNIREIGLFEKSTGDLLFYTKCYPIFKHKKFDIHINYRISEESIIR